MAKSVWIDWEVTTRKGGYTYTGVVVDHVQFSSRRADVDQLIVLVPDRGRMIFDRTECNLVQFSRDLRDRHSTAWLAHCDAVAAAHHAEVE